MREALWAFQWNPRIVISKTDACRRKNLCLRRRNRSCWRLPHFFWSVVVSGYMRDLGVRLATDLDRMLRVGFWMSELMAHTCLSPLMRIRMSYVFMCNK